MEIVIEEIYNLIEAIMLAWFVTSYFKTNNKFQNKTAKLIVFTLIFIQINIVSILGLHWVFTLIISSVSLLGISTLLLKGTPSERIVISSTAILLLALSDICAFTLIGKLLGVDYKLLVIDNTFSRFLAVSTSKVLYLIVASIILFFKKKYSIFVHKREAVLIIITLLISGLLISLIRNIIYEQRQYYNIFLVVLLCVLLLNVIIYYAMIYIGKKNADEKDYSLMQKQLELQSESIQALEQKYDETAKIRHDITMWIGWDDESKYSRLFFIIFPLIAVLPYCWSYCSDYKNGYTNIAIEKLGKFKYHKSKYIAVFISSGLVISIPLIVDFLIILLFIPATVPDSVYDIYYGIFSNNFMAGMFYSTPFMYIIIFILLNFVYCGLFGCIGYAASTLIKNKIISVLSPNIIVLTTEFIKNIALEKNSIQSNNFSPFTFLFPAKSINTNWFIIVTEIVLLFVCTFWVSTLRLREKSNLNLRYFYEK